MMKKNLFMLSLIMLLSGTNAKAQAFTYPLGARAIGMGHNSLVIKDYWAIFNNQAAAAFLPGIHAGVFMENRFLLDEMNRIALGVSVPVKKGSLFVNADHFGGKLYSELKAGAGYAMHFGEHFSAGLQLDYLRIAISEGYGSHHAFTFEGGIHVSITEKLSLGFHIFNPLHVKWSGTSNEHIPVTMRAGLGFKPEASLTICAEIMKSTADAAVISAGVEYRYKSRFFIRAGITSGPARYTFGAGFRLKKLVIDIASSVHSYLGYSPQLSFTYSFEK